MQVAYIITEDSKLFGLFDVIDMFQDANELAQSYSLSQPSINVSLIGRNKKELAYQDFLTVKMDNPMQEAKDFDLVLIPAFNKGDYASYLDKYEDVTNWLAKLYEKGATLCSLCSGAFLLAATGLLDGKFAQRIGLERRYFESYFLKWSLYRNTL